MAFDIKEFKNKLWKTGDDLRKFMNFSWENLQKGAESYTSTCLVKLLVEVMKRI